MKAQTTQSIDVHNDQQMIAEGIRPIHLTPRDKNIWEKSYIERKNAYFVRRKLRHAFDGINWPAPSKSIPVYGKLIVYVEKNNKFSEKDKNGFIQYKTTFSHKCMQSDITKILDLYSIYTDKERKDSKSLVIKYKWNGKTYNRGELPYWFS